MPVTVPPPVPTAKVVGVGSTAAADWPLSLESTNGSVTPERIVNVDPLTRLFGFSGLADVAGVEVSPSLL